MSLFSSIALFSTVGHLAGRASGPQASEVEEAFHDAAHGCNLPALVDAKGLPRTREAVLAEYWGDDWSTKRALITDEEVDLHEPLDVDQVLPWSEARLLVRAALSGSEFPEDMLHEEFRRWHWAGDLHGAGELPDSGFYAESIAGVAQEATEYLRAALDRTWEEDDYERSPLVACFPERDPERGGPAGLYSYTDSFEVGGWFVRASFESGAHPQFEDCLRTIDQLALEYRASRLADQR